MKKCPYCGHDNRDEIDICQYCHAGFPHNESQKKDSEEESKDIPRTKRRKG